MNGPSRRTRFEERIRIEREFLTPINSVFAPACPLAGMTRDTIEAWRKKASRSYAAPEISALSDLLLEASARANLLADNSKDVFEPEERPNPDSIALLADLLRQRLAKLSLI